MTDQNPSPQSVIAELLKHSVAHYGHPKDETCGVGLLHAQARALLAAPAPPAMTGGEVNDGGYDRSDVRYGLHLIANEDCDEVAASYYAKKALAHLAALSPEAPARKGVQWGWRVRSKPNKFIHDRPWHWQFDEPTGITAENCEYEPVYTSALTPRHEAPAEGAGEWITGDQLHAIMQSFTDRADVSEIASKINAAITLRARSSAPEAREEPVEVTIFCPQCALPHVDEGDWATTRRHKTHQCQGCGHEWRPFPFATVGVSHPEALNRMERVAKFFDDGGPDFLSSADSRQHGRDIRSVVSAFREGEPVGWKYEVFGPEGRSRSVRSVIGPKPNVAAPVGGYVLYDALYAHPDAPSADKLRFSPTHRHLGRGSTYEVIGEARLQQSGQFGPVEGDSITVYRGEDGQLWCRAQSEFEDGRFEALSTPDALKGDAK